MSYLDLPRLHFSGKFMTNPSTINNTPDNFNPENKEKLEKLWNPGGPADWKFEGCKVTQVSYADGTVAVAKVDDSIIGTPLKSWDFPFPGKLVDLDPYQQAVSQVWAFRLFLGDDREKNLINGKFNVAAFTDMWGRMRGSKYSHYFCAYYQSRLENMEWNGVDESKFLKELKQRTVDTGINSLSIKFNVDAYNSHSTIDENTNAYFTYGRVSGTIGPVLKGEPEHFVNQRLLSSGLPPMPSPTDPKYSYLYFAPFKLDKTRKSLVIDMGNSLPTTYNPEGEDVLLTENIDIPKLELVYNNDKGEPVTIGVIDGSTDAYMKNASVSEFNNISKDVMDAIEKTPLFVTAPSVSNEQELYENSTGFNLRADSFVFRMNSGDTEDVTFYAANFGKPASGITIDLAYSDQLNQGADEPPAGTPTILDFPHSVTTDENGKATFTLKAGNPGNPRKYIDGQVYAISYTPANPPDDYTQSSWDFISVLVHTEYTYEKPATWKKDVRAVLAQYGWLYPFMGNFVNMQDYGSVYANKDQLKAVFEMDINEPNCMPVTRDLSKSKLDMILEWIKNDCPEG